MQKHGPILINSRAMVEKILLIGVSLTLFMIDVSLSLSVCYDCSYQSFRQLLSSGKKTSQQMNRYRIRKTVPRLAFPRAVYLLVSHHHNNI